MADDVIPGRDSGRILDAGALKALAHPLRVQLLNLLQDAGASTASSLARQVGETSGSTSYHLRQLARHGLIEEAPELGTGRDRYWQPVPGGWTLRSTEMIERPDTRAAAEFLLDAVVRDRVQRLERWHRDGVRWGEHWVSASLESNSRLRLTRDRLRDLNTELFAVLERYRSLEVEEGTPDSAMIAIHVDGFPMGDPPSEPPTAASEDQDATTED